MIRTTLVAVVAAAAGFCAGHLTQYGDETASAVAAVDVGPRMGEAVSRPSALEPADVELLKRELVSAVADAIAAGLSPAGHPVPTSPPETDETIAANAGLQDVLDRAVASGAWTNEDSVEMKNLMRLASAPAVEKSLSTLVAAINDQHLRLGSSALPF